MSKRVYKKEHQEVLIESVGPISQTENDIWYVTATLEVDLSIRSIWYTHEVKELIAGLESKGWKKEITGDKE